MLRLGIQAFGNAFIQSVWETNNSKTAGILKNTAYHLALHSQYSFCFKEPTSIVLPRVASVDNAYNAFLCASFLLFFLASLSLILSFLYFLCFPFLCPPFLSYFLPLFWLSSILFSFKFKSSKEITFVKFQYLWKRIFKT